MFQLTKTPAETGDLIMQGPKGFELYENCQDYVEVDPDRVFGEKTAAQWPDEYAGC